jgi:hypothetical protein
MKANLPNIKCKSVFRSYNMINNWNVILFHALIYFDIFSVIKYGLFIYVPRACSFLTELKKKFIFSMQSASSHFLYRPMQ